MIGIGLVLAAALLAGDAAASSEWAKALVFEFDRHARVIPEHASRAQLNYQPLSSAEVEAVRPVIGALTTASADSFATASGIPEPIAVSYGQYPNPTGPGMQRSGLFPAETLRREMGTCTASDPESVGADATTSSVYVMVRLSCPSARGPEWRTPYAAIVVRHGRAERLMINIGDLPNVRLTRIPSNG